MILPIFHSFSYVIQRFYCSAIKSTPMIHYRPPDSKAYAPSPRSFGKAGWFGKNAFGPPGKNYSCNCPKDGREDKFDWM